MFQNIRYVQVNVLLVKEFYEWYFYFIKAEDVQALSQFYYLFC